jgi:MFS family permease
MMLTGALLSPLSARLVERIGPRVSIIVGLAVMAAGCLSLAALAATAPVAAPSLLLMLIGLGGPLTMLPSMSLLLNSVHGSTAGTASGVLNTSRQVGGALAVAVFGALLASRAGFVPGLRLSLLIAAGVAAVAAIAGTRLNRPVADPDIPPPLPPTSAH